MATVKVPRKEKGDKDAREVRDSLYYLVHLTEKVPVPFTLVGRNIQTILKKKLETFEGRCIKDGLIRPGSIRILSFSDGQLIGSDVIFDVYYSCYICNPVEGQKIRVKVENISKAGIRASYGSQDNFEPLDVFIPREHNQSHPRFKSLKRGVTIDISIIGKGFELNDPHISVIAELI